MRTMLLLLFLGSGFLAAQPAEKKRLVFPPLQSATPVAEPSPGPLLQLTGPADPLPTPPSSVPLLPPAGQVERFFDHLKASQVEQAYETLTFGTIIRERREDIEALKEKTAQALDAYGDIAGYDVLETREAGPNMTRMTCLSLNSDLPLRWRFYFYQTRGAWRLIDIRIDDGLAELFDDSTLRTGRTPQTP